MNDDIVIVSAVRTPIGRFCRGTISELQAHELGSIVIREALSRAKVSPEEVSEVVIGQVLTAGHGHNPARQASIGAGIPYTVPAYGISMICGSGLKAVISGYEAIAGNKSKIIVCGGQESMSQARHAMYCRNGTSFGDRTLVDTMLSDGLTDVFHKVHLGETAEILADKFKISRAEQDEYALQSQQKARAAIDLRKFEEEIVPVCPPKSGIPMIDDEYPQLQCTIAALQKLKPVFRPETGTVTAGNVSGLNDGAAALVLMRRSEAQVREIEPLGRIVDYVTVGVEPLLMGLGPIPAITKLLSKLAWTKDEVDLYEINEAFAVQSIVVLRELDIDINKVNTRGGAIALGHPLGASGARILVTLLYTLKQTGSKRGIVALCIGGGMGIAMAVERN